MVTEIAVAVCGCGQQRRVGVIRSGIEAKSLMPKYNTKSNYKLTNMQNW